MLTAKEKIEEAHGLWEIAIVRLAAFVEVKAPEYVVEKALADERAAFANWSTVSSEALQ